MLSAKHSTKHARQTNDGSVDLEDQLARVGIGLRLLLHAEELVNKRSESIPKRKKQTGGQVKQSHNDGARANDVSMSSVEIHPLSRGPLKSRRKKVTLRACSFASFLLFCFLFCLDETLFFPFQNVTILHYFRCHIAFCL